MIVKRFLVWLTSIILISGLLTGAVPVTSYGDDSGDEWIEEIKTVADLYAINNNLSGCS